MKLWMKLQYDEFETMMEHSISFVCSPYNRVSMLYMMLGAVMLPAATTDELLQSLMHTSKALVSNVLGPVTILIKFDDA